MGFIDSTTQDQIRRPRVLLDVRNYQCSIVRPSNEKGLDSLYGGVIYGGSPLHYASGRVSRKPSTDRESGTRSELSGSDELDRETLWVIQRESDQSLSRVLNAVWLRFLWWKTIADYATEQTKHYEDTWDRLERFNDAVKEGKALADSTKGADTRHLLCP